MESLPFQSPRMIPAHAAKPIGAATSSCAQCGLHKNGRLGIRWSPREVSLVRSAGGRRRCNAAVKVLAVVSDASPKAEASERTTVPLEAEQPAVPVKASWRASIDFRWIRDNKVQVADNIRNRKSAGNVELVVQLYEQFCSLNTVADGLRAERNAVAKMMKGKLDSAKREELIERGKQLKDQLSGLEAELAVLEDDLQREGQRIPNMTHPSVPVGSEDVAVVRKVVGAQTQFGFAVKDHVDLGLALDLVDFEAAAVVSGTKFYYLKNEAVLLEMALINWTLSQLRARGFVLLTTPDLVRSSVLEKCGFQPRGANSQVYSVEDSDLCLAGTAEIPLGGLYMDNILPEAALPLKLVAFSHCFRTEAGAAGAATRGLYRVHQFSKVEMFAICTPQDSDALHDELIAIEEELFTLLGLHFKVLDMSSEDLGAPAHRKYDVEAWMPGLGRYGEISSASNCTDYQSRRLNIRYRPETAAAAAAVAKPVVAKPPKPPAPQFVHTLNATACAVPRMIVAILENFQQEDGSVVVPEVLRPFMGCLTSICPKTTRKS